MAEPSEKTLAAIGRLITEWATLEGYLSAFVGLVVATERELDEWKPQLNPKILASAVAVAMGSSAKATLAQLEFLLPAHAKAIHKIAAKVLLIKAKRDRIAHASASPNGEQFAFSTWGASRSGGGKRYLYSAAEINGWAASIRALRNELQEIVFQATGTDFQTAGTQVAEWTERHQAAAKQHVERLTRLTRDHEAKLVELEQQLRSLQQEG